MSRNLMFVYLMSVVMFAARNPARAESLPQTPEVKQVTDSSLVRYREKELSVRYSFFNGLTLQRAGKEEELGFFGGGYEEIFLGSPAALESMSTYRTMRITGTTLWVAGLTVLVAEIVMLSTNREMFIEESNGQENIKDLFWALLIPGAVVGITGGVMMQSANGYLTDAIHQYNDDLYNSYSARALNGPPAVRLSWQMQF